MFKISNKQLADLDKEVGEFYKLSYRYLSSLVNIYGRGIYKQRFSDLMKASDKINPESEFDALILKNIKSNLLLNDLTIDFCSDSDFSLSVQEFFDKLAGKGAYDRLEEMVKSAPWDKRWICYEKDHERGYSRVSPFIDEAQKAAREWIPLIKKDILEYGKSEGYLPDDFEMEIYLLPPREGAGSSSWNSKTRIFSLGSYGFEFFPKKDGVLALPTKAYCVAFHEVIGHGAHQMHSEDLPHSVRFTQEVGGMTPTKSITEGIAINAEKKCYEFLRKRLSCLGLKEEDVSLLEEENELENNMKVERLYFALINERASREKGFEGYPHILQLTRNPVLARMVKDDFKKNFMDMWGNIGHTLGPMHYQKMLDNIELVRGKDYIDTKDFHKVSLRGVWSREVYPEAVAYMAKEK